MTHECLQDKTGSCLGCNVLNTAEISAHKSGIVYEAEVLKQVGKSVQKSLCPEGKTMQTALLRPPNQSIW